MRINGEWRKIARGKHITSQTGIMQGEGTGLGKSGRKIMLGKGTAPENPERRLARGRAQARAWDRPGKRLGSLAESLFFPEPKEIYES